MDWLFAQLTLAFGVAWVSMFNGLELATVKVEWRRVLGKFRPGVIPSAYELMLAQGHRYPPNLSEYAQLCRDAQRMLTGRQAMLPDLRRDRPPPGTFESLRAVLRRVPVPRGKA